MKTFSHGRFDTVPLYAAAVYTELHPVRPSALASLRRAYCRSAKQHLAVRPGAAFASMVALRRARYAWQNARKRASSGRLRLCVDGGGDCISRGRCAVVLRGAVVRLDLNYQRTRCRLPCDTPVRTRQCSLTSPTLPGRLVQIQRCRRLIERNKASRVPDVTKRLLAGNREYMRLCF
jgi:hypothetical protein